MGFWIFMVFAVLLIPLTMIFFGRSFMKHPPKKINGLYGYRTSMSMKNMDTWIFAHRYCGKLWFYGGILIPLLTIPAMLTVLGRDDDTVGMTGGVIALLQLIPFIGAILPTERALKKHFDPDGRKRLQ